MRKISLVLIILVVSLLLTPSSASAHGFGPPILAIDGGIANNNPIFTSSTTEIPLGMDIAPENYVINKLIKFELNRDNLPAPKEVIDRSTFGWDFIDGSKATGLAVEHTFSKPGTYIVKITVTDPTQDTTFDLDTVQMNLLPNKDYQLPKAKIKINGKSVEDPIKDTFKTKQGDNIEFDASGSSGDTLAYQWDFGDGTAQKGKTIKHTYAADFFPSFPLLRVTDKNGLVNDTFAEFFGETGGTGFFPNPAYKPASSSANTQTKKAGPKSSPLLTLPLAGIGGGILVLIGLIWMNKARKKNQNSTEEVNKSIEP